MGPEAKIQKKVKEYAEEKGAIAIKLSTFNGMGTAGWPDYFFLARPCRVLFIEFKAPKEKPSKLQADRIKKLRQVGATVEVIDDIAKGKKAVDFWLFGEVRKCSRKRCPAR
jgi:hypothetical protein